MDLTNLVKEECENVKKVASKFGEVVVCDEDDKSAADVVMPAGEECENIKTVVSKVGVTVVCDEEA